MSRQDTKANKTLFHAAGYKDKDGAEAVATEENQAIGASTTAVPIVNSDQAKQVAKMAIPD